MGVKGKETIDLREGEPGGLREGEMGVLGEWGTRDLREGGPGGSKCRGKFEQTFPDLDC